MRGADALHLARNHRPMAVSLDVVLPDMLGWAVLSELKQDPATRHIPVQVLTVERDRLPALARGAYGYLSKPLAREGLEQALDRVRAFAQSPKRRLLVVAPGGDAEPTLADLLGHADVETTVATTAGDGLSLLRDGGFDCVIADVRGPATPGFELLEAARREPALRELPFIAFAGSDLPDDEQQRLRRLTGQMLLTVAQSRERLLDECSLFLHCDVSQLPQAKQETLRRLYESDEALADKKVLVIDDDVRNIFALSSVLERHRMKVVAANTGRDALRLIEQTPDLSLVLLDIMMPEMDGYETLRGIRSELGFQSLPVIALTAKAMKGDREKCLEAGASDYIAKPVDAKQLLALMRVWLRR
jgi:CheY-like chemotaxis protein